MPNSRQKGARGERELAAHLRAVGIDARRGQQHRGGGDSPDVVAALEGVHLEVKRTERFRLYDALAQAVSDADGKLPIVVHRQNRREWVAVMRLDDLLTILRQDP